MSDTRHPPAPAWQAILRDPRHFQIGALSGLLLYGLLALRFDVLPAHALVILATALFTQWLCMRWLGLPFDARSPLISSLSLILLLRTDTALLAALAAAVTIASKFLLRIRDRQGRFKHVFNPTNFGLVVMILLTGGRGAWVSPGQWGETAFLAFLLACLGMLVVHRAARSDVTWAFVAAYSALLFGRAWWLGDPLAIPLHQLQSGALLIFAFFMISDPKTTPDSRAGRILFAALVALGAGTVHFVLFRPNGLLWSLAVASPLVPLIDRLLPGRRYRWPATDSRTLPQPKEQAMRRLPVLAPALLLALLFPGTARAFCGFYVARADTKLFNQASQVVMVRDGDRTVLTMANDFSGEPTEFAVVIPVPTFLTREQIHVADKALIDHLDAYTSPRLVEYFDESPCWRPRLEALKMSRNQAAPAAGEALDQRARALGVTIEAAYTVGEYDILILSAKESQGLTAWLTENGYRLPAGAERVVGSYLKQGMRFFVAKVNLGEQAKLGFSYLRPLQVAYESPKFMLPIRLGTVNARGAQQLYVYALTRSGRVETTNYRTVRLPSDVEIPVFVKDEFGPFYRDLFTTQVGRERGEAVFLEYAWDMGWCDPCAADPLLPEELRELGVFWLDGPGASGPRPRPQPWSGPQDVFVTRLHLRYDREHFPADLVFQETGDRSNFQGRYILRHPWTGGERCPQAQEYFAELARRQEREAQTLAHLTGWKIADIRRKMDLDGTQPAADKEPWWRRIWGPGGR